MIDNNIVNTLGTTTENINDIQKAHDDYIASL